MQVRHLAGIASVVALLQLTGTFAAPLASGVPAHPADKTIVHVLNRLGFGPAPGDVDRIRRMGLDKYIDQQLRPETLIDPPASDRDVTRPGQSCVAGG